MTDKEPLLTIRELTKTFRVGSFARRREVQAVRGVSFDIAAGTTLGLVGESGSGKSTTGRAIARLIEPTSGIVSFDGTDVSSLRGRALKEWRRSVGFVFQDPYGSLDSRMQVQQILAEPLRVHGVADRRERRRRTEELVEEVGLSRSVLEKYPHEFSGGQRQRLAVARALALRPRLIIADEPVSALDVSVQAQVLNLFKELQDRHGLAYLFISHDLDVVDFISDQVAVMYLGEIVEHGMADEVLSSPAHPYTQQLLEAAPRLETGGRATRPPRLTGEIPSPENPPPGCSFHTRCPRAQEICAQQHPVTAAYEGHGAACHFADLPDGRVVSTREP